MPPDLLPRSEKMDGLRPDWHGLAADIVTVLVVTLLTVGYVAWYMEQFDEATQPVPVPQEVAGAGYQYGEGL